MAQELISEPEEFGARLALALNAINMSRSQLSAALCVDKSVVSRWMSGQVAPSSYNLARISSLIANARPGFNMTCWTAPRAEFEAALGLSSPAPTFVSPLPDPHDEKSGGEASRGLRRIWPYAAFGTVLMLLLAGGWAFLRGGQPAQSPNKAAVGAKLPASVAVMPFVNMSGDASKEYLGDGISEEILNDLANTPNLRVAARTSSFSFKGKHADIAEIARKLNVRSVLEGSVREEGNRIRIVAQLINAADGFHLWSARYDRKPDDILAVQDEIARAIVAALTQKLTSPRPPRRIDPKAYQEYLAAQYFFNQRTGPAFRRANELLKDTLARQPDFTAALALRGHVLMLFAGNDEKLQEEGRQMTSAALRLNPDNQDALDTQVQRALRNWEWDAAYSTGHRILARKIRNALSYNGIGFLYQYMGFPQQALEARRQAAQLDPLHFSYRMNFALSLLHVGRMQEATAAAEAALELQPSSRLVLDALCTLNAQTGKIDRARDYAGQLNAQIMPPVPNPNSNSQDYGRQVAIRENINSVVEDCNAQLALATEPPSKVRAMLDRISENMGRSALGVLHVRAGDLGTAMKVFSEAYDRRDQGLVWVRYDAATPRTLLRDPRWITLWRQPLLREWQTYHDRIAADIARAKRT